MSRGKEISRRCEFIATILYRTMFGYAYIHPDLLYKKILKRLTEGEKPAAILVLAYIYRPAVVIKTQLVVPDNRHCNAVTLV